MNGTRHAIATFRNSPLNKNRVKPKPFGDELADLMLHSRETAEISYLNPTFLKRQNT
jgi:hypothetical protein